MARPILGPKPLFPAPLPGQNQMLFPVSNCHSHECNRSSLRSLPHSRCSCENMSGTTAGFNQLLSAITPEQINNSKIIPHNMTDQWLRLPTQTSRSSYESLLLNTLPLYGKFNDGYPSLDYALLANARRKNATRETTTTLKTWLNEHKKNPYPTKGEKVMLAILTKMTLTQVSTWFANARRRLKKENKMTWSPRKKNGEKKDKDGNAKDSCSDDDDEDSGDDSMDIDVADNHVQKDNSLINEKTIDSLEVAAVNSDRPSVIRALESPTFNEIRDRFSTQPLPVNDLQKWVNGCFQDNATEINDFPPELTPPSTPIESKVTTFTSQKLFEAFDAAKLNKSKETTPPPSITDISPVAIFSSKQPVLSTRESNSTSPVPSTKMALSSVMTPQPSPKNEIEFFYVKSKEEELRPKLDPPTELSSLMPPFISSEPEVRVQGLTTSRELEAVLALTNMCTS